MQLYYLQEKLFFLRQCIQEVESQVFFRKTQTQEFVDEIVEKTCQIGGRIYSIQDHLSPRKADLEQEVRNLEREVRQQKLDCWRDVNNLLRDLRQLRKEYQTAAGALWNPKK